MPSPAEIIDMVASLQNDTAQQVYTDAACLPYLNMALDQLQEEFERNNIPITNEVSAVLTVPAGTTVIAFTGTTPLLPAGLKEIQRIWESISGENQWVPMTRREFIPHFLEQEDISSFMVWAWMDQEIHVPAANRINDLKLDYVKSIFSTPILIADVNTNLPVVNAKSYLGYKTAALCSMFIGENSERALALETQAEEALARTLGISNKGKQAITTRRRPFRSSYKRRSIW